MKKQNSLFAVLTAALTVSVCGCGNVDGISPPASSGSIAEQTSSLMSGLTESSSDLSGLTSSAVNSEVGSSTEFPNKCKIYKQTSVQFTDEQLFDWFDRFPECGEPQKSEYYSGEYHRYEADGCEGYISDGNCFSFWTKAGNFYDSYYSSVSSRPYNDPDRVYMSADGELDFASRDEVLQNLRTELAESFGIMPEEWWALEFSAVKKEGLEAYKQSAYESAYGNTDDTDDTDNPGTAVRREKEKEYYERIKDQPARDFYHIEIRYKVDDIPIFYGGILDIDKNLMGRAVFSTISSIVYTERGIEDIVISPAYETDFSDYTEAELLPAEQARGLLQKKYEDIISDSVPEVDDMKLIYLPIPQNDLGEYSKRYELRPHYVLYSTETEVFEGETIVYQVETYFDAVTGIELASQMYTENGDMAVMS